MFDRLIKTESSSLSSSSSSSSVQEEIFMRVLRHKSICSSCFRKLSQGLHPSSAPNLEDTQQISPCDCPTVPDLTNGHVIKSVAFQPSSPSKLENETPEEGPEVDADDEVESFSSMDDGSLVIDARDEQAFDGGVEEKEIGKDAASDSDGVSILNSVLKKGRKCPSSSGPNLENKRVKWVPDEELTQIREFDQCSNQDEDDENRNCGCIIL